MGSFLLFSWVHTHYLYDTSSCCLVILRGSVSALTSIDKNASYFIRYTESFHSKACQSAAWTRDVFLMWVTNVTGHPKIPAVSSSAAWIHGYEDLSQMDFKVHGITHYCPVIFAGQCFCMHGKLAWQAFAQMCRAHCIESCIPWCNAPNVALQCSQEDGDLLAWFKCCHFLHILHHLFLEASGWVCLISLKDMHMFSHEWSWQGDRFTHRYAKSSEFTVQCVNILLLTD